MKGLRVLEIGNTLASAYCGRLFAATGSDVVLAEPSQGGPVRALGRWSDQVDVSLYHEFLNAGKRSTVHDSPDPSDDMIMWADVVISSCDGDPEAVSRRQDLITAVDRSVVHVVTSGFGLTGPYSTWRASPLVDWASGGYLYITGDPEREPVQGGGVWPSYITGATAAIGAQAAVMHAVRTGEGQLVDVGAMEAVAAAHQWTMTMVTHTGAVKRRWGARFGEAYHPMSLYECSDGRWILVGAPSREQWENFCITVDARELLIDDELYAPAVRFERADEIDRAASPWIRSRTAAEAVAQFQSNRVPASQVFDFADVLAMEQVEVREALVGLDHLGDRAKIPGRPFVVGSLGELGAAPDLGAHTVEYCAQLGMIGERSLPQIDLSEVRAVEFSVAWAGPLAGRFLGDLGVDVVKVEHPTARGLGTSGPRPDRGGEAWSWGQLAPARIRAEVFPDAEPGDRPWNRMGVWNKMNRCKRSLCLDAKADGGMEALAALVASSDLLVHNYSPRGARSLGIDHERLVKWNDRVVSIAMTGYGETGPMSTHSSYGPILEACAGVAMATGYTDQYPNQVGVALPDAVGGLHGAFAALAGLWEQRRSGSSVHVDLSQFETMLALCGESLLRTSIDGSAPTPVGNRSGDYAPQGVYRCAGGEDTWVALTVTDDAEWRALAAIIGDPLDGFADLELSGRRAHHDQLDTAIGAWTLCRTATDVAKELQQAGIPVCPVFNADELVQGPHTEARGFMVELTPPDVGPRLFPGSPIHLSATPVQLWEPPTLGQHNEEILIELGYGPEGIETLRASHAIACEPPM